MSLNQAYERSKKRIEELLDGTTVTTIVNKELANKIALEILAIYQVHLISYTNEFTREFIENLLKKEES